MVSGLTMTRASFQASKLDRSESRGIIASPGLSRAFLIQSKLLPEEEILGFQGSTRARPQ